ncbi:hypothetical protein GCM10009416_38360 [Craurococcus roseus]|uniref:Lipoprotein n=1 Tax=Craurococcus roseus TaxID=77585 RepID=A0ABN1FRK9_9PROT
MTTVRIFGGLALSALFVAACQPQQARGPLATMPRGTNESVLRQQQFRNMQQDPDRAVQNPPVVGVNPGTTGIVRAPASTGEGSVGAGPPVAVNPGTTGITRERGVGAPSPRR